MSSPQQQDTSLHALSLLIWNHLEERDWLGASSRNLATSIALESAELLEHYQWSDKPVGDKQALADELADIFIYAFQFAQENDIDIAKAITHKLEKAAQKYPAKAFKGKRGAARQEAWIDAKRKHQKDGL
ncbi:MAG TPA: MazG-like family protein [Candidatus Saccharimonadales bacterium]|nr:MazG-like family protein [Candidatus Saccharimonadales bacterium]